MKYFVILLLSCFVLISCDDFLDENNQDRVTPSTIEDMSMLITRNRNQTQSFTDVMADDFAPTEDFDYNNAKTHFLNAMSWADFWYSSAENDLTWKASYEHIYIFNVILNKLPEIKPTVDEDQLEFFNSVNGQALALRAIRYFELVNDYANHYDASSATTDLGVPIKLSIDLEQLLSRSTVEEVYDQILSDLNASLELLPPMIDEFPFRNFRPGLNSAYALLARVHLYREEWQLAKDAAEKSLDIHSFLYDYSSGPPLPRIPEENLEVIWHRVVGMSSFLWGRQLPDPVVSSELEQVFDTTSDLRWRHYYTKEGMNTIYFPATSRNIGYTFGITVPEVMLSLAEADARLGNISEALDILDQLRVMRYDPDSYQPSVASTAEEALELVLNERRRELAFMGIRWWDIKRLIHLGEYDKTITHIVDGETFSIAPNSPNYALAIPLFNIALNPNLEQNPREGK